MYSPVKQSRSLFVELRGLTHHIRVWGDDDARTIFLFHGAWDASATFQFLVDALKLQWRVLALMVHGDQNKQIAYKLGVGEPTVKAHVTVILRKLGVRSRTQAVIEARGLALPPA